jgi:mannose-6-phosphate isomerase
LGTITLDGEIKDYKAGETIIIPQGVKHRIENKQNIKVVFIEVQTGTYFGEDDIVRIEDDYNRV